MGRCSRLSIYRPNFSFFHTYLYNTTLFTATSATTASKCCSLYAKTKDLVHLHKAESHPGKDHFATCIEYRDTAKTSRARLKERRALLRLDPNIPPPARHTKISKATVVLWPVPREPTQVLPENPAKLIPAVQLPPPPQDFLPEDQWH
ncbi:hypothetical protein GcC1_087018 [Golovinomyces cichoracearum]|uniref:Uncharacterized protein n=1 Tax=Golovinomyces cichoracearum TaxID=62708 RepID=A0A420IH49_9PEZI|nr:hypothetical protein GcC1_087018 [Golovinomyces cichoracearum]